ncbi:hypothetical protein [Allorhizobium undicola]|uniref:hypothetical protein n=1 Tax=Allorhizobium undicola TaxID=78527 RepID=UPI0004803F4C|nr:hypothetical protein [Allorhizobium undicola]
MESDSRQLQALLKIRKMRAENRQRACAVAGQAVLLAEHALQRNEAERRAAAAASDRFATSTLLSARGTISGQSIQNVAMQQQQLHAAEQSVLAERPVLEIRVELARQQQAAAREALLQAERKVMVMEAALDVISGRL